MEYPVYKGVAHSGIEWLGNIPHNWEIKKLGFIGDAIIGLTYEPSQVSNEVGGILVLRASNIQGAKLVNNNNIYVDAAIPKKLLLKFNDILICSRNGSRDLIGKNGKVDNQFIGCSFGAFNTVFRSHFNNYVYHVLNSSLFEYQSGSFLTSTINQLTIGTLNTFKIPFPPIEEQQKIANFLDYKTQQIDQLIKKKKALIEKLNEQRIAVITQAVTKGIDKNAKMKPSGVDWLGDVPEHWEVLRAKFVSSIFIPQRNKPILNTSSGIYWTTMDNMKGDYIQTTQLYVNELDAKMAGSKILKSGSIIASCVGNFGITSINLVDVIINQQLQAFIPIRINPEYLKKVVSISGVYFELVGTAATLIYVNQQGFENMPVPLPPNEEQKEIVTYIEKQLDHIDKVTLMSKQTVEYYEEYRSSLITAAVTGKIDVRQFSLPPDQKEDV